MDKTVSSFIQDGRYDITTSDTGIYLSVWAPTTGGTEVSKAKIIQDLKARNCIDFDSAFISTIIREAIGKPVLIINSQPQIDGHYDITTNDAGVYLSVWAPTTGGAEVSKAEIIQDLKERNCIDFDSAFISAIIREAIGKPVLIINSQPQIDGHYDITTNDAGVYLSVWAPTAGGTEVSKAEIIQDLKERNCIDFDSNFISAIIREAIGKPVLIINSHSNIDGHYDITTNDAGVYLSVWAPTAGGIEVSKAEIMQDLKERNCIDFDSNFISTIIREAIGKPVLIINSQPQLPVEQAIRVKVRIDHMEAQISINLPSEAPLFTFQQLMNAVKSAGVVYGIDERVLQILTQARTAATIVFARGTLSCPGEDAYLKYYIDPDSQGRPVELEDGRVDYKETNHFLCVEKGQLLVEKIPATPGIPGTDVFCFKIPPINGKDIAMPTGKNVVITDGSRLYAAIDGHLDIFDKRINVIPTIVIDGDVDYSTGNIDFMGSVIVRGSVQPNFVVKAGGNVEICGTISGGSVEAANIIVRKGIQGMKRSVIKARERLVANFIENAVVYANQDILISDVILNSEVFAGMRVIVEGSRGLIRGGRVSAGEVIRANTIGTESGVTTEIEVSINSLLKDELCNIEQECKKASSACERLKLSLDYLYAQGIDCLSAEKRELYTKQEAEYNKLLADLEELPQRKTYIMKQLNDIKPGRIRVSGFVHTGTVISIGLRKKVIKAPYQFVSFYVLEGEIKFSSLLKPGENHLEPAEKSKD